MATPFDPNIFSQHAQQPAQPQVQQQPQPQQPQQQQQQQPKYTYTTQLPAAGMQYQITNQQVKLIVLTF